MFFLKDLTQTIFLHPSYFTPALQEYLRRLLLATVEGVCFGDLGYVVSVVSIEDLGRGKIRDGGAEFEVSYSAIVYRPFRGEVVDGIVSNVNKMGIFVDVGPVSCFISTHLIPSDFQYDPNANPPCFTSTEDTLKIEKGTPIRLKIVGTRIDAREIFAIGTIKEDYLGPLA